MSRNFRYALLISVFLHILFLSAVALKGGNASAELRTCAPVTSLGSLLGGATFDLLGDQAGPETVFDSELSKISGNVDETSLKAEPPDRKIAVGKPDRYSVEKFDEGRILTYLNDHKELPGSNL